MLYLWLKFYHVMQTTNDIFVNPRAIKKKNVGKLADDTEQVSEKKKTVGCQTRANPPLLKSRKERKVPILCYFFAFDFVTSYISDVTNGAIQSPSLKGFIGTNFISIQIVQQKLRQLTSGA